MLFICDGVYRIIMMKTAFLFSGQGSQYVGMMKDLYESFPIAKRTIEEADEILGFKLSEICFDGPFDELKKTKYTQPALFLHSVVITKIIGDKVEFHAVGGHSVGECAALFAAGVLNFEDALRLVAFRGELMFNAGEFAPGAMFAVIGAEDSLVEQVCQELTERGNGNIVVPANYNCPGQIVVSGSADYIRENIEAFKKIGAKIVKELAVSGAFHSPLMKPAQEKFAKAIESIPFNKAKVPVYVNAESIPVTDGETLKELLIRQLTSPVKWTQSILRMRGDGITKFVEIGAGNVLQGLVKRTVSDCVIMGVDKAEDLRFILPS